MNGNKSCGHTVRQSVDTGLDMEVENQSQKSYAIILMETRNKERSMCKDPPANIL